MRTLALAAAASIVVSAAWAQGTMKERLTQDDILTVVKKHKVALQACLTEQKRRDPQLAGTVRVQWTILPSGKTTKIGVDPDEFRKTYLASCVAGVVKSWTFPPHRVQGEAVDLPITF